MRSDTIFIGKLAFVEQVLRTVASLVGPVSTRGELDASLLHWVSSPIFTSTTSFTGDLGVSYLSYFGCYVADAQIPDSAAYQGTRTHFLRQNYCVRHIDFFASHSG